MIRLLPMLAVTVTIVFALVNVAGGATWVVDDDGPADYNNIQAAVDAAGVGDIIEVRSGRYIENVNVNKRLTLQGEGTDIVNVIAYSTSDHVFEVTEDYVNISGFNLSGTINWPRAGIYLSNADHCNIFKNNVSDNACGISLISSNNNMLTNNTANSNQLFGIYLYYSSNNTLTNNIANYLNDCGIYLHYSSNNTLTNNTANSNYCAGISLLYSSNNTLTNNIANSDNVGIYQSYSSNNTLTNNIANYSTFNGIYLFYSSNNTLTNNAANSNSQTGISLYGSSNNFLTTNTINSNTYGIYLTYSTVNTFTNNIVKSNNNDDIYLSHSSHNSFYLNNFIDNNQNTQSYTLTNICNSTTPITYTHKGNTYRNYLGNYWDDYIDIDADNDGIWDNPYSINSDNDYHPLVEPFENYSILEEDWKNEWMGEDSDGGTAVTTVELQKAIHHWLGDIPVRGHIMSSTDIQEIIAIWLSG